MWKSEAGVRSEAFDAITYSTLEALDNRDVKALFDDTALGQSISHAALVSVVESAYLPLVEDGTVIASPEDAASDRLPIVPVLPSDMERGYFELDDGLLHVPGFQRGELEKLREADFLNQDHISQLCDEWPYTPAVRPKVNAWLETVLRSAELEGGTKITVETDPVMFFHVDRFPQDESARWTRAARLAHEAIHKIDRSIRPLTDNPLTTVYKAWLESRAWHGQHTITRYASDFSYRERGPVASEEIRREFLAKTGDQFPRDPEFAQRMYDIGLV